MRAFCISLFVFLIFWALDVECQIPDTKNQKPSIQYQLELSAELTDHKGAVGSVAFSPDGRFLASGSADSTVKLWDADSGKRIKAIMRHPSPVMCVAFSPDSNILASGSETGEITLWDVNYKERIKTLKGHEDRVWTIRFSPDGALMASGSTDNTVRLWNMNSGKEIASFKEHEAPVHSLSFSPDGGTLASASADGTMRIWDVKSQKNVMTLKESTGAVNSICFSPDGKTLAAGTRSGDIRLWDVASGEQIATLGQHGDAVGINDCLSFSPDGRILISGASDKKIMVWDIRSLSMLNEVEAHKSIVNAVAFRRDGRLIASAGLDGIVKLWRVRVTESLNVTLNAQYKGWQRGIIKAEAETQGLPDLVKFQYSLDDSTWLDIAEKTDPPYSVDWNTRSSIPEASKGVRLRVIAQTTTGITAMDIADATFDVDNEPPVTEHDYDGLWHKADFDISLSANDGIGIGVSDTKYRLNSGQERDVKWNGQPKIEVEGTNTLEYWSADRLGNEEPHKDLSDIKLDKTAPTFSGWDKKPENLMAGIVGPFRASVRVLDEGGSGLTEKIPQLDYHIGEDTAYDGYEDMSEEGDSVWYFEIPEPTGGWNQYGGETIYYKVRCEDVAGNVGRSAERQELLGSPKTPPAVKMTSAFRNWESGILAINAEASDIDGIIRNVKFEYSFDNVLWTLIGETAAPPYSVEWDTTVEIPEVERTVWVQITATDDDELSATYITPLLSIDNQLPSTSHDYDGLWHKADFAINLTADDGSGSGISSIRYRLNGGSERSVATDGQPKALEQGDNTLEYWSIDVAGNEEPHNTLSSIKLDRLPPIFEDWHVKRDGDILQVEVSVVDDDSGIEAAPQVDFHVGLDTRYLGYRIMERVDDKRWKYDVDISSYLPDAAGEMVFFKTSARDAVGNLEIRMWEYVIAGETGTGVSTITEPKTVKPAELEEDMDIKSVSVIESKVQKKKGSIVWTVQGTGVVKSGEKVTIQGHLEPAMDKSVPLRLTVMAPNETIYVAQMDTDPSGTFMFSRQLDSEGEWRVIADWEGDAEHEPVRSKILVFRATAETPPKGATLTDSKHASEAARKTGSFLKKNVMIIGILALYVIIIRINKS